MDSDYRSILWIYGIRNGEAKVMHYKEETEPGRHEEGVGKRNRFTQCILDERKKIYAESSVAAVATEYILLHVDTHHSYARSWLRVQCIAIENNFPNHYHTRFEPNSYPRIYRCCIHEQRNRLNSRRRHYRSRGYEWHV